MGSFPFVWPRVKRVCVVCGREFEGRSDAQTCSSPCRQALYRRRLAEREKQKPRGKRSALELRET